MGSWRFAKLEDSGPPHLWSGADISDDRLRALSLGAINSFTWRAYHDVLPLTGPDGDSRENVIDTLHDWWGISSAEEALDTVARLHRGMHSPSYDVVHPLVMAAADRGSRHNSPDELPTRHMEFLRELAYVRNLQTDAYSRDYELWLQAIRLGLTKDAPKPFSSNIRGWDLGRASWVVRAAVSAGYLEPDHAWTLLEACLNLARSYFRNWRQFGDSFLTGHAFWSSRDLADCAEEIAVRRARMMRLWQLSGSPWRRVALCDGDPVY